MSDTPLSNPPTVDDALRALNQHTVFNSIPFGGNLDIVRAFLERLTEMSEPECLLASDIEGFIIDGAFQKGFEFIDNNADLLVVHKSDLIKYVLEQRTPHWISTKRRPLPLGLNVKAWDQPIGYPLQVWAGFHKDSPKTATCDWFIELPPLPAHDVHDAPAQILKKQL